VRIRVNDTVHLVRDRLTLAELIQDLKLVAPHVAVERNLEVVPRSEYPSVELQEGDRLEIVTLVGGG